ncbi:MAG TPA: hypothetical protein VJI68_02260 [Candidatus Nanoarchaeia archaeon]|nr:hypothetical protein [Candidatus Nanoarchaeia archaeon]
MLKVLELVKEAEKQLNTADHLAKVSYPILKENKILLSVVYHLFDAGNLIIEAILLYEKLNKKINYLPTDFESKLKLFETEILSKNNFDRKIIISMNELNNIIKQHKESPIEFSRKENFVICNDDYSLIKILDVKMLYLYIEALRSIMIKFKDGLRQNV